MTTHTSSRKPSKQRKAMFQAPLHIKRKFMTAPLAEELVEKYGVKRLPVRKGDKVRIMRGEYTGVEGKVVRVDLSKTRIFIEGVTRQRMDGTPVFVPIHPSKVLIVDLDLSDPKRKEMIEKKKRQVQEVKSSG